MQNFINVNGTVLEFVYSDIKIGHFKYHALKINKYKCFYNVLNEHSPEYIGEILNIDPEFVEIFHLFVDNAINDNMKTYSVDYDELSEADRFICLILAYDYSDNYFSTYDEINTVIYKMIKENFNDLCSIDKILDPLVDTKSKYKGVEKMKQIGNVIKDKNIDTLKIAAQIEAGNIIVENAIKYIKKLIPKENHKYIPDSIAGLVIANSMQILAQIVKHDKLTFISEAALQSAMLKQMSELNIEKMVKVLLKGVDLKVILPETDKE